MDPGRPATSPADKLLTSRRPPSAAGGPETRWGIILVVDIAARVGLRPQTPFFLLQPHRTNLASMSGARGSRI